MYNQFFTIKPRISKKNGGSKVVHLRHPDDQYGTLFPGGRSGGGRYLPQSPGFPSQPPLSLLISILIGKRPVAAGRRSSLAETVFVGPPRSRQSHPLSDTPVPEARRRTSLKETKATLRRPTFPIKTSALRLESWKRGVSRQGKEPLPT